MAIRRSKLLVGALALVAILSLVMNFTLLIRLSEVRTETEYWKNDCEQLALRAQHIAIEQKNRPDPIPNQESLPQVELPVKPPPKPPTPPGELAEVSPIVRAEFSEILASVIEEKFPELQLSEGDLMELEGAIRTIRDSMQAMHNLSRRRTNAEVIRKTRSHLAQGLKEFEQITGMKPGEFMNRARPEPGIDNEESDDDEIVTEYLRDFEP